MSLTFDASSSLRRVSSLYAAETIKDSTLAIDPSQDAAIVAENATFQWGASSSQKVKQEKGNDANNSAGIEPAGEPNSLFTLRNINISVPRGKLVAVVGSFASGKSSLLQGLAGEMHRVSGRVSFSSQAVYCPQVPWLRKGTLVSKVESIIGKDLDRVRQQRDNIVFGKPFDAKRYQQVLKDVCLASDIRDLSNGDWTEVR
jgi:ABC-type multidrug transport system fused ATPase/permease subunit